MRDVLDNLLKHGDLSFRDFVEIALYHPVFGYYARSENPVGKGGDYVTAPTLSPLFSHALGNLVREFLSRSEGGLFTIVDIGCGDGSLIRALAAAGGEGPARFFGVDRHLARAEAGPGDRVTFVRTIDEVPADGVHLILTNELYDALPFARLVQRAEHLHELWVTRDLEWIEREAPAEYEDYFAARGIELEDGQFADVSLEWMAYYEDVMRRFERALIVTIDYGFPGAKLFHPRARRFGTAAAYSQQRVTRDLLANPGEQDLTAHINFSDLERAGEKRGAKTLFFDRLAKFLLTLDVAGHELLAPLEESAAAADPHAAIELWAARDDARRLILPDGIGEDLRVLIQAKGLPAQDWPFQRRLF